MIEEEEEEEEEYPCLSATFQYRVMSEDIFISPIFSLQPLLVAALDRKPA
jgi:hypothetical protein